jgi:hypothetical protein
MYQLQNGTLQNSVRAINVSEKRPTPVVIESGTRFEVLIGQFEWLGHDGLYSEITLAECPGLRFRVRYHQLYRAAGRTGTAGILRDIQAEDLTGV